MTQWLAGMKITAARLNSFTPVSAGGSVTAATNFTVSAYTAYDAGGNTSFVVVLAYSGSTLTGSSSGNITDTQCCTLPIAPQAQMTLTYQGASGAAGNVQITNAGVCKLVTLTPTATISSGDSIQFSGTIATG